MHKVMTKGKHDILNNFRATFAKGWGIWPVW